MSTVSKWDLPISRYVETNGFSVGLRTHKKRAGPRLPASQLALTRAGYYTGVTKFPQRFSKASLDTDSANVLAAAVCDRKLVKTWNLGAESLEERRDGGTERAARTVGALDREARPAAEHAAEQAFGPALRDGAFERLHHDGVRCALAADQLRMRPHSVGDAHTGRACLEAGEHVGHPFERECERHHAAAVDGGRDLVLVDARRGRDVPEIRALHPVARQAVALRAPLARSADGEHARVLAGAVVLEPRRWIALAAALKLVLARVSTAKQHPNGCKLLRVGAVRRRGDGKLARVEVVVRLRERQRLERLRRRAEERDEIPVSGLGDATPALHRDGVHDVRRLGDAAAAHDYPDGVGGHEVRTLNARASGDGGLASPARRAGQRVPDRQGGTGARRDAEDLRPAAVDARRLQARGRPPQGEAPAVPHRGRRARAARPPDARGEAALPARRREGAEDPGLPARVPRRRPTRPHRGRLEETRRRVAPHTGGGGGGARAPRAGGARARRGGAGDDLLLGGAAAPLTAARPTCHRGDRTRLGERDPAPRAAVALRAVEGPRRRAGAAAR